MRLVNLIVVVALVLAAAYVYKIKFDSTVEAERVAKLRTEIRRERDAVAALRAEWSKLDNPSRIEGLAKRHLTLRPIDTFQLDGFDRLPLRPPPKAAEPTDPIGAMIDDDVPTGSVAPAVPPR
jgi:cell division protein FtsL